MRHLPTYILALCILLTASAGLQAGDPHPFNVKDLVTMKRLSSQTVSPDGKLIAFVLRETDMDANKGRTDLWLVGINGTNMRRLTAHPGADYNPIWSKDGKWIYFISTRSGSSQVWRIPFDGGEASQVTDMPLSIDNLKLSPDGKKWPLQWKYSPMPPLKKRKRNWIK